MKKLKQMLMMLMMLAGHSAWSATVSIPQELGKYIDWNNAALTDCKVENNGANIGSTHSNSAAVFTLSNPTEQNYCMTMKTGASGLTAVLTVTVKNGTAVLFTKDCDVDNTGSWATTSEHWFDLGKLPVSDKLTLEIKVKSTTGSYAGNYGDLALYGVSQFDNIPSAEGSYISLSGGTHSGARYEEKNDNIGYITNATYSIYNVWNTADVFAAMKMDIIGFYNAGQVKLTVTDVLTGAQEAQQTFDITAQENGKTFPISEPLTKGLKKIRMDYVSESDGFIMNYKNLQLVKVSDYSPSAELTLKSLTVEGFDLPAEGLAALKENGGAYTLAGNLYTSVPRVEATMSNLAGATVTSSEVQDGKVVFTIKSTNYQSTLTVEGLHIYAAQPNDQTVQLKYTSEGKSGDGTGNYLQDITIRNNYDFRAQQLKGVSVALTGGNKTIMKNVALQASQDTYVTGKRTYLEDCDIYGTTDFICGGGDIYFERCNLILGNKSGNVISAPSTSPDNKWGYVFRKNSPTSTNSYKPVLTEDEAQRFTLRNVLGGTDSWDAATFTKQCAAPADAAADGTALQWAAVENALCYVVFKDGEYAGNTTATSFNLSAAGTYSVRAANAMGGMGEPSAPVEVKTVTSVSTVSSCEERGVYKKTQNGQLVIVSPQCVFSASGSRLK